MLVVSKYIAKHELAPLARRITVQDILVGARKVANGLGIEIKASVPLGGVRFFKVRVGRHHEARMIVFVVTKTLKVVPVLIRLKKDKIFGMNMAMNNSLVIDMLIKNTNHVIDDLQNGAFEEFSF